MIIETERLILRSWREDEAEELYKYACDPQVGPIAGWPAHKNVEESLDIIRSVYCRPQCYAICLKENGLPIGTVELKLKDHTDMTDRDDECEVGYWLGRPFWGHGYMPEAVKALLDYGFNYLNMTTIWCGYYKGNDKSRRVQEKCGFSHYTTSTDVEVPLMHELRTGHMGRITRKEWEGLQ